MEKIRIPKKESVFVFTGAGLVLFLSFLFWQKAIGERKETLKSSKENFWRIQDFYEKGEFLRLRGAENNNGAVYADELRGSDWEKDLMARAEAFSLRLERLEPAGIKETSLGKEETMFLYARSEAVQIAKFVYQLMESAPLVRMTFFVLRRAPEIPGLWECEIILGKPV